MIAGRRWTRAAAAAFLAALLVAHFDIVIGNDWRWGDDVLEYAVPLSHFVKDGIFRGDTFFWNPHEDCGTSIFNQPAFMGPFYPAAFLFLLPSGIALNVGFLLHALIGAAGAFALARRSGQGPSAALISGFLFGASSSMRVNVASGYLPNAVSVAWLPWVLWALESGRAGTDRHRAWALAAGACGLSFLGGNAAVSAAGLVVTGLFAAARIVFPGDGAGRAAAARYWIPGVFVTAAGGLAVAAPQVLPSAAAVLNSVPGADRSLRVFEYLSYEPWRLLQAGVMGANPGLGGSLFVGMTGFALAALGAFRRGGTATVRALLLSGAATYFVFVSPWLGAYQTAAAALPPLLFFGGTYQFEGPIPLFLSLLAGAGFQRLAEKGAPDGSDLRSAGLAMTAVFLFAGGYALWYRANPQPRPGAVMVPVVIALPVVLGVLAVWRRGIRSAAGAAAALMVVAAAEAAAYCAITRDAPPARYSDAAYFDKSPLTAAAAAAAPAFRLLPYETRHLSEHWQLQRNEGMVNGYHSAFGNAKIPTRRFAEYTRLFSPALVLNRRPFYEMVQFRRSPAAVDVGRGDLKLLSMMNVRYIASDTPLAGEGSRFLPGPAAGDTRLFENPYSLPRAYSVGRTRTAENDSAALAALASPDFDPWSEAILTGGPALDGGGCGSVQLAAYRNGRVAVSARQCRARAALLLSDQFDRDWRATIDGVEAAVYPANHLFRGVVVGPGDHLVEFRYAPRALRAGTFIGICAWVLLLAATIRRPRRAGGTG